ncbi:12186_t:CDS:1, partial [Ambispora leptoticha]
SVTHPLDSLVPTESNDGLYTRFPPLGPELKETDFTCNNS